jgi:hypothetical protein
MNSVIWCINWELDDETVPKNFHHTEGNKPTENRGILNKFRYNVIKAGMCVGLFRERDVFYWSCLLIMKYNVAVVA